MGRGEARSSGSLGPFSSPLGPKAAPASLASRSRASLRARGVVLAGFQSSLPPVIIAPSLRSLPRRRFIFRFVRLVAPHPPPQIRLDKLLPRSSRAPSIGAAINPRFGFLHRATRQRGNSCDYLIFMLLLLLSDSSNRAVCSRQVG